jgi:hypothetical protein
VGSAKRFASVYPKSNKGIDVKHTFPQMDSFKVWTEYETHISSNGFFQNRNKYKTLGFSNGFVQI